jgi:hypothetical protein
LVLVRLGWFLSSALLKVKITTGVVAFLEWDFQIVAAVGAAAVVAAAEEVEAVEEVVDFTAHLGGTASTAKPLTRSASAEGK